MRIFAEWSNPTCPSCGGPLKGRGNGRCYCCSPGRGREPGSRKGDGPGHYPPRTARLAAEGVAEAAIVAALAPLDGMSRRRVLAGLVRRATVGDLKGGPTP